MYYHDPDLSDGDVCDCGHVVHRVRVGQYWELVDESGNIECEGR